jgi:hypothetical protein
MRDITTKHIALAAAAFAVLSIALLWSWNTLASLLGGPTAEFKHLLAVLVVAATLRGFLTSRRRRRSHRAT